jgi:hypothetical protein
MRATVQHAGFGLPTVSLSCTTPPTTPLALGHESSPLAGRTSGQLGQPSSSPSRRSSSHGSSKAAPASASPAVSRLTRAAIEIVPGRSIRQARSHLFAPAHRGDESERATGREPIAGGRRVAVAPIRDPFHAKVIVSACGGWRSPSWQRDRPVWRDATSPQSPFQSCSSRCRPDDCDRLYVRPFPGFRARVPCPPELSGSSLSASLMRVGASRVGERGLGATRAFTSVARSRFS